MTRRFWHQVLINGIGYVLCVIACKYVVQFPASEMAKIVYRLKFSFVQSEFRDVVAFYAANWLFFNVISGIACGATAYSFWRNPITTLVWVPSFCVLCQEILTRPHSVLGSHTIGPDVSYFVSVGCREISDFYISQRCTDQLNYSLPLYAAVGFSTGTLLSQVYWKRRSRLTESSLRSYPPNDTTNPVDEHGQPPENHQAREA